MKIITLFFLLIGFYYTGIANAADSQAFVDKCRSAAISDFRSEAKSLDASLDEASVKVDEVDARWYNPSKYVWFTANAVKRDGSKVELPKKLKQYYQGSCGEAPKVEQPKGSKYIEECKTAATSKLKREIEDQNGVFAVDSVELDEIDARWYNPSKYLWFKATGKTSDGKTVSATVMVQKSILPAKPCGDLSTSSPSRSGTNNDSRGATK